MISSSICFPTIGIIPLMALHCGQTPCFIHPHVLMAARLILAIINRVAVYMDMSVICVGAYIDSTGYITGKSVAI